jgi:hypothetical protein
VRGWEPGGGLAKKANQFSSKKLYFQLFLNDQRLMLSAAATAGTLDHLNGP